MVMCTWTGCCRKSVLLERVFCPIPSCAPVWEDGDPPSKEQVKWTKKGEEQSDFGSGHLGRSKNCANIHDAFLLLWPRLLIFTSGDFPSLWFVCIITQFRSFFWVLTSLSLNLCGLLASVASAGKEFRQSATCVKSCFLLLALNLTLTTLTLRLLFLVSEETVSS